MVQTTTIRIDHATHEELKRLAAERRSTVAETVARAVRVLRQEQMDRTWLSRSRRRTPTGSMLISGDVVRVDLELPSAPGPGWLVLQSW